MASEEHFLNGRLQLSCVASIDKSWQARADDAAVGVLGNVTEQTNHLVISAVSSEFRALLVQCGGPFIKSIRDYNSSAHAIIFELGPYVAMRTKC